MTLREKLASRIQSLPDSALSELIEVVEKMEEKKTAKKKPKLTLMERLKKIRIDGPSDFSENFDLYMNGEKSLEGYGDDVEKNGDVR